MLWPEIRNVYPNQWLVVEALQAHTTSDQKRQFDLIAVSDTCSDGMDFLIQKGAVIDLYDMRIEFIDK